MVGGTSGGELSRLLIHRFQGRDLIQAQHGKTVGAGMIDGQLGLSPGDQMGIGNVAGVAAGQHDAERLKRVVLNHVFESLKDLRIITPGGAETRVWRAWAGHGPTGYNRRPYKGDQVMQTTLVIIKPDAVQRGLIGRIVARFEDKGLQIIGAKMIRIDSALADHHYEAHVKKDFYPALKRFMTASPVMVLAVYGRQAIEVVRKMMGATNAMKAEAGTIRGDLGISNTYNLVHGSDSEESAARELALFFRPEELIPFEMVIEKWVVDKSSGKAQ